MEKNLLLIQKITQLFQFIIIIVKLVASGEKIIDMKCRSFYMEKMTFNDKLKIMCDIFFLNHKKLY